MFIKQTRFDPALPNDYDQSREAALKQLNERIGLLQNDYDRSTEPMKNESLQDALFVAELNNN